LIGKRNDGKPPWTFVAGEVEPGEQPEDAAVREVKKETGLEIEAGEIIGEREHPATHRQVIYMSGRPTRGLEVFVGDRAELAEVRWVSLDEAGQLLPGCTSRCASTWPASSARPDDGTEGQQAAQPRRGLGVAVPDDGRRAVGDRASVLRHAA
jgi:8-oxo-dGTP diphosphatase